MSIRSFGNILLTTMAMAVFALYVFEAPAAAQKSADDAANRATEKLRQPTQQESQALAELSRLLNRSAEGLKVVEKPDGSRVVNLQGRFASAMIAKKNLDGTVSRTCVGRIEDAGRFLGIDVKALKPAAPAEKSTGKE